MILLNLTLLASAAAIGMTPTGKLPHPALGIEVAADTVVLPSLTEDVVKRYIALRRELDTFWKIPANQALADSATQHGHKYSRIPDLSGSSLEIGGTDSVVVFDYVELAAHHPAIMAIFTKSGLTPPQFTPTHVALLQAAFAGEISEQIGQPLYDPESVLGKNVALVQAHQQELTDLQVIKHLKQS